MMVWFLKKEKEVQPVKPEPKPREPEKIYFSAYDDVFTRARKLFRYIGLIGADRLAAKLAEGLSFYQRVDAALIEGQKKEKAETKKKGKRK